MTWQLPRQASPRPSQVYGKQEVVPWELQEPLMQTLDKVVVPFVQDPDAQTVPLATLDQLVVLVAVLHRWQGTPGRREPLA